VDPDGDEREDAPGDDAQNALRSRARAKVNRPFPTAQTFGTGEPRFAKVAGRSPGSDPTAESGRRAPGELPRIESERPFELGRKPEGALPSLRRRLKGISSLEWLLALALLAAVVLVILVARARSHA